MTGSATTDWKTVVNRASERGLVHFSHKPKRHWERLWLKNRKMTAADKRRMNRLYVIRWRERNPDLFRKRVRDGMRKLRERRLAA